MSVQFQQRRPLLIGFLPRFLHHDITNVHARPHRTELDFARAIGLKHIDEVRPWMVAIPLDLDFHHRAVEAVVVRDDHGRLVVCPTEM